MKLRQCIYIAAVIGVFALSVFITCAVSSMFWQSFENRDKIIDMDVSTYRVKYNSVWDKMKIFSKCEQKFEQVKVELSDENKQKLIDRVNSQITVINRYLKDIVPDISEDKIKSCTQYVNYGNSDANGFAYWYLVYDGENDEIRMIVDTEFMTVYKIYMTEKFTGKSAHFFKKDGKIYEIAKSGQMALYDVQFDAKYLVDWSDFEVHSNLFLEFYKMTMNKMPDFNVASSAKGIEVYAVYYDDFEDSNVEVPFLVRNTLSPEDGHVFEWGMTYFDELIQQ